MPLLRHVWLWWLHRTKWQWTSYLLGNVHFLRRISDFGESNGSVNSISPERCRWQRTHTSSDFISVGEQVWCLWCQQDFVLDYWSVLFQIIQTNQIFICRLFTLRFHWSGTIFDSFFCSWLSLTGCFVEGKTFSQHVPRDRLSYG